LRAQGHHPVRKPVAFHGAREPAAALASDLMAACLLSIAMSQARQSEQASGSRIDLGIPAGTPVHHVKNKKKGLKACNQMKLCPPSHRILNIWPPASV